MNCCSTSGPCRCHGRRRAMAGYPHPFAYQGAVNYGNARRRRRFLTGLGDAGLPGGSRLSYTATWQRTPAAVAQTGSLWNDPNTIQSLIQPVLSGSGVIIDGQTHTTSDILPNVGGTSGFTLQLHTISDRNAATDVQSIIDGAIYSVLGIMPKSQIIVITVASQNPYAPLPDGSALPPPPSDLGTWLTNNWWIVALIFGGVVVAEEL